MNARTPLLSIVIPVYNEGASIREVLRSAQRAAPSSREILVVYDFDEDNTLPGARELQPELPELRLIKNLHGRGVLNALKTGIQGARGKYVLVTMADGSDNLGDLPGMIAAAESGAVVVAASRYMPGGHQLGGPRLKRSLSRTAGLLLHYVGGMPIHDPTSNFKLYSAAFLRTISIESSAGFELALEFCVKAYQRRLPMAEVPTTWTDRTAGTSHFNLWRWLPHYLRWFMRGIAARVTQAAG